MDGQTHHYAGLEASGDLSASKHRFVKAHTVDNQVAVAGAGEDALGVLYNAPAAAGRAADVRYGTVMVECGAAVTGGGEIMANASGQAINATATNVVVGRALEDGAGAGSIIKAIVQPLGYTKA
jgi:hypothetical protein